MSDRKLTQEIWDKINTYCLIHANTYLGEGQRCFYIADEATSTLMRRMVKYINDDKKNNDNYYFMSSRNAVIDVIRKELKYKKSVLAKDIDNIQLDELYEGMDLELPYKDTLNEKFQEDLEVENKISSIIEVLESSPYIKDLDVTIFVERYLNGLSIKDTAKKLGVKPYVISDSTTKTRNVIKYFKKQIDKNKKDV